MRDDGSRTEADAARWERAHTDVDGDDPPTLDDVAECGQHLDLPAVDDDPWQPGAVTPPWRPPLAPSVPTTEGGRTDGR